jgi:hypothetical protein
VERWARRKSLQVQSTEPLVHTPRLISGTTGHTTSTAP